MDKKALLKIILLLVTVLFIYGLINREADLDDAWLGELAYFSAKLGYAKSELMRGITLQHVRHLSHHKLLTLQGALFIQIFGFSLYVLKAVTLVYFIAFLLIFYFYTYKRIFSPTLFYVVLLLFLANAIVFDYAFVFRPEIPVMTLGFLSYLLLNKSLARPEQASGWVAGSGFLSGLCVATHLNGVIFPIAGFLLLVWNRNWKQSLVFGFATLPAIAVYFYDFTAEYNLEFWLYQLKGSPSYQADGMGWGLLLKLLNEHKRFFHSLQEASLSVTFMVTFVLAYKYLQSYKNLIRYTALLVLSLGLISVHKHTSKYMLLYLPYMFILMGLALKLIYDKRLWEQYSFKGLSNKAVVVSVNALLLLFFGINIYYDIQTCRKKQEPDTNRKIAHSYFKGQTKALNVVAPMTFIFHEIDHFNRIQAVMCYTEMQKNDKTIFQHGFLRKTREYGIDYIILSGAQIDQLGLRGFTKKDFAASSFEVLEDNGRMLILKSLRRKIL